MSYAASQESKEVQSGGSGDVKREGIGRFRGQVAAFEVTAAASSPITPPAVNQMVSSPAASAAAAAVPDPSATAAMLESSAAESERLLLQPHVKVAKNDRSCHKEAPANRVADNHRSARRRLKEALMQLALQRVKASHSCEAKGTEVGWCGVGLQGRVAQGLGCRQVEDMVADGRDTAEAGEKQQEEGKQICSERGVLH
ncbi:unnamed protein product [Closterium sp. Naga37s-1]|nr:unnamed protein product [Closterium sp. Naga37s-1]